MRSVEEPWKRRPAHSTSSCTTTQTASLHRALSPASLSQSKQSTRLTNTLRETQLLAVVYASRDSHSPSFPLLSRAYGRECSGGQRRTVQNKASYDLAPLLSFDAHSCPPDLLYEPEHFVWVLVESVWCCDPRRNVDSRWLCERDGLADVLRGQPSCQQPPSHAWLHCGRFEPFPVVGFARTALQAVDQQPVSLPAIRAKSFSWDVQEGRGGKLAMSPVVYMRARLLPLLSPRGVWESFVCIVPSAAACIT